MPNTFHTNFANPLCMDVHYHVMESLRLMFTNCKMTENDALNSDNFVKI